MDSASYATSSLLESCSEDSTRRTLPSFVSPYTPEQYPPVRTTPLSCQAITDKLAVSGADRYPFPISTIIRTLFLTPSQGSLTSLFALTSPLVRAEATTYKGSYLVPFGATGELSELGKNEPEGRKLWEMSEKILADGGVNV
jgi:hypothetical protein